MSSHRSVRPDKASNILTSASKLFRENGVKAVSVDEIVKDAGVAKGTFYLYFNTKDDLLEKLAEALVRKMAQAADAASLGQDDALDGFAAAVVALKQVDRDDRYLADALDHPESAVLHDLVNVALVRQLAPVFAKIVDRGKASGVFEVEDSLATLEFILAGQAALLGGGRFHWSPQEHAARLRATLIIIERALGAQQGGLLKRLSNIG